MDTVDFADELVCNATALEFEVATLASCFAATSFFGDNRNFSHAHYGYLMASMGQLDVMSQCWNGPREPKGGQTARMRSFMREYLDDRKLEEHRIAVQLLRHTTMHTGALRPIYDPTTDCAYTWRIHFGNTFRSDVHHYSVTPLPSAEQNYVLDAMSAATSWAPTAVKAFNLQLTTFVTDIRRAAERYTSDMTRRSELKGKCQGVLAGICFQEVKLRALSTAPVRGSSIQSARSAESLKRHRKFRTESPDVREHLRMCGLRRCVHGTCAPRLSRGTTSRCGDGLACSNELLNSLLEVLCAVTAGDRLHWLSVASDPI